METTGLIGRVGQRREKRSMGTGWRRVGGERGEGVLQWGCRCEVGEGKGLKKLWVFACAHLSVWVHARVGVGVAAVLGKVAPGTESAPHARNPAFEASLDDVCDRVQIGSVEKELLVRSFGHYVVCVRAGKWDGATCELRLAAASRGGESSGEGEES